METLAKYLTVFGIAMLKVALGPLAARGLRLSAFEAFAISALGMTFTAFVVAYVGERVRGPLLERLKRRFPERFDRPPNPRLERVFARWGMAGIAFLTPVLLSPPGGALAAVAFGVPRERLVFVMAISAVGWCAVYTAAFYVFGDVLAAHGLIDPVP